MATVKVRIRVRELSNVMIKFEQIKVYRSDLEDGTYAEITGPGTRVDLVAEQTIYEFIDTTAPTSSYWYKTSYFHTVSLLESSLSGAIQGIDAGLYCTIQDLRDEGITENELSDDRALVLLWGWQLWFEDNTGLFFTPKEAEVLLDGDGSRMLLLPVPIIECTALYANDDFVNAVDSSQYVVYDKRGPVQDDRRNPHIMFKRSTGTSIYSISGGSGVFLIGDRNQRVDGTFGYVEYDGSTPPVVKQAIKILTTLSKELLPDGEIDQLIVGRKIEEVTDRHRIEYSDLFNRLKTWGPTGITMVDAALRKYRRPMRIGAPRTMRRLGV
jgi:hypothetical protein